MPRSRRDKRTLRLICDTFDIEPRTVRAGWVLVVKGVSLAIVKAENAYL